MISVARLSRLHVSFLGHQTHRSTTSPFTPMYTPSAHFSVHTFPLPPTHLISMSTVKGITGLNPPHTRAEGPIEVIV
jgi:hypothetical protein